MFLCLYCVSDIQASRHKFAKDNHEKLRDEQVAEGKLPFPHFTHKYISTSTYFNENMYLHAFV